jgi:SAM-dependent methyltransferase
MIPGARHLVRTVLPAGARRWMSSQRRRWRRWRQPGAGRLRQLLPASPVCGFDRGLPIDRYYIERFLNSHAGDIRGHVLEFGDDRYTRRFGGERVTESDVLEVRSGNPKATLVADLTAAEPLPSDAFDCIICVQTLQFIYDVRTAVRRLSRLLKPGGVLLVTAHGIGKIVRKEGVDPWGEYWRLTSQSLRRMLRESFPGGDATVQAYGNVFAAASSLYGLAAEDLRVEELDYLDPDFQVVVAARVVKSAP